MRHFPYLGDDERSHLFAVAQESVTPDSPRHWVALALGATLYAPATRPALDADALRAAAVGATSMVWCLEDAIPDDAQADAEANVVATLRRVHAAGPNATDRMPLLFVRVRTVEQIRRIAAAAAEAMCVLTGFSLPKVTARNAREMLTAIREVSADVGRVVYAMPILETPELAYVESRRACLSELAECFTDFQQHVLCVRVGGTDLSGLFGLRRDRDTTIWDVAVVRDALADIVNQFARRGDHVVTGAVWEHFPGARLFKPQLRESPFREQHASRLRKQLIGDDVDALMREISLDKINGIYGKTVIHPTHVPIVNSMLTVQPDEYDDALAIHAARQRGGVLSSPHGRMNELGPHALWAEQILARAAVFGVLADDAALVDLLRIGQGVVGREYPQTGAVVRVVS